LMIYPLPYCAAYERPVNSPYTKVSIVGTDTRDT
jgi:hypothetical protein